MKVDIVTVLTLATVASGAAIEKRQARFDLTKQGCKDVILVFARGTTEAPNIVRTCLVFVSQIFANKLLQGFFRWQTPALSAGEGPWKG